MLVLIAVTALANGTGCVGLAVVTVKPMETRGVWDGALVAIPCVGSHEGLLDVTALNVTNGNALDVDGNRIPVRSGTIILLTSRHGDLIPWDQSNRFDQNVTVHGLWTNKVHRPSELADGRRLTIEDGRLADGSIRVDRMDRVP